MRNRAWRLVVFVLAVVAVGALVGTAIALQAQRFPDVPPDHEAFEAIEWAAGVGVTTGYDDGTFKPARPLSKRHAVVFMERYYDEILGAEESEDFTRGDMMVLLKAINDGASDEPEPEPTTGRLVPRPEDKSATGRCAPATVMDTYAWETCAWNGMDDPSMSRTEMSALVGRVWQEVKARHKPIAEPRLTEGYCGPGALGCYLARDHTVRLDAGFTLSTLLHELAHAITAGEYAHCGDDWTHTQPACAHDDVFRCAADALYRWYGDVDASGVCGDRPPLDPGQWELVYHGEVSWGTIHASAALMDGKYDLHVRCYTSLAGDGERARDVVLGLPKDADSGLSVRYRVAGGDRLLPSEWRGTGDVVRLSDPSAGSFIDQLQNGGHLWMSIAYADGNAAELSFDLGDSPALDIVNTECKEP